MTPWTLTIRGRGPHHTHKGAVEVTALYRLVRLTLHAAGHQVEAVTLETPVQAPTVTTPVADPPPKISRVSRQPPAVALHLVTGAAGLGGYGGRRKKGG